MSQFFIGGRGSDFKPKCPIILCPNVPREGGCQARMGQCPTGCPKKTGISEKKVVRPYGKGKLREKLVYYIQN